MSKRHNKFILTIMYFVASLFGIATFKFDFNMKLATKSTIGVVRSITICTVLIVWTPIVLIDIYQTTADLSEKSVVIEIMTKLTNIVQFISIVGLYVKILINREFCVTFINQTWQLWLYLVKDSYEVQKELKYYTLFLFSRLVSNLLFVSTLILFMFSIPSFEQSDRSTMIMMFLYFGFTSMVFLTINALYFAFMIFISEYLIILNGKLSIVMKKIHRIVQQKSELSNYQLMKDCEVASIEIDEIAQIYSQIYRLHKNGDNISAIPMITALCSCFLSLVTQVID